MKYFAIGLLMLSHYTHASNCEYSIGPTKIMWTAFKTPKKVGVNGLFDRHTVDSKKSTNILDLIKSATFTIDTTSVNTGNPSRDKTIVKNFFMTNSRPLQISGKVIATDSKTTKVLFDFNGYKKEISLKNKTQESKILIEGSIDVIDVGFTENLNAIHKACEKLHEGKTWAEVNISIEGALNKKCN